MKIGLTSAYRVRFFSSRIGDGDRHAVHLLRRNCHPYAREYGPVNSEFGSGVSRLVSVRMFPYRSCPTVMSKPFTRIAIGIFGLVALVHLLRLILGWEVIIEGQAVPMYVSVIGLVVAGGLALLLWYESC